MSKPESAIAGVLSSCCFSLGAMKNTEHGLQETTIITKNCGFASPQQGQWPFWHHRKKYMFCIVITAYLSTTYWLLLERNDNNPTNKVPTLQLSEVNMDGIKSQLLSVIFLRMRLVVEQPAHLKKESSGDVTGWFKSRTPYKIPTSKPTKIDGLEEFVCDCWPFSCWYML